MNTCCPLSFTTSEMHNLTTTQKHRGKNSALVWRKVCCKQGAGKKEICELNSFSEMKTHSFSIIACDKNTFYIASWFSSEQAFFVFSWGWAFFFFPVNSGSQSKWQVVGMVSLHFAFSWRNTHRRHIDVHHRNSSGPSDTIFWKTSPLPQTFCVTTGM